MPDIRDVLGFSIFGMQDFFSLLPLPDGGESKLAGMKVLEEEMPGL
jgi:hypothetical protein